MPVSLKCQYALRALFALAKKEGEGMLRINEIAEEQDIPPRYLENICNQLRQGGFVEGKRGKDGGFVLSRRARDIRIGDIIRFIEGPIHPTNCATGKSGKVVCRFRGSCIFIHLWDKAEEALKSVYDNITLMDLVEDDKRLSRQRISDYSI
ncbi:MAG: Rrf2 family transcriptional regulator [Planctomycetota bacterium]|jgi:Rrf2 family protein|nr:Rrf2 family transcriptional regulator [Planctomycetota bacterium]